MEPGSAGPYTDVLEGQGEFLVQCVASASWRLGLGEGRGPTNHRAEALRTVWEMLGRPEPFGPPPPFEGFGRLAEVIEQNRPLVEPGSMAEPSFQAYLLRTGQEPARRLWDALDLSTGSLLDLGGGWGAYAGAWLDRHSSNRAIVVDLPEVVAGIADPRIARMPGRIESVTVPPSDVALLANVLHNLGEDECREVLRAAALAAPVVVVEDFDRDPMDPARPALAAWFALDMALYTESGDVYPPETIAAWMVETGLRSRIVRLPADRAAVIGRR